MGCPARIEIEKNMLASASPETGFKDPSEIRIVCIRFSS
jgi:hypothetical protein